MSVYIDLPRRWNGAYSDAHTEAVGCKHCHMWCHLWCDPGEEESLHRIAAQIGMRREWFQDKPGFPHYDLIARRHTAAIKAGAISTNLRDWIQKNRKP